MLGNRRLKSLLALFAVAASLVSCTSSTSYSPFLRAEPAAGSVLNRAPRNLRLFYDALPDVPNSGLTLTGPDGNYDLRGFSHHGIRRSHDRNHQSIDSGWRICGRLVGRDRRRLYCP